MLVLLIHSHSETTIGTFAVYDPGGPHAARAHAGTGLDVPAPRAPPNGVEAVFRVLTSTKGSRLVVVEAGMHEPRSAVTPTGHSASGTLPPAVVLATADAQASVTVVVEFALAMLVTAGADAAVAEQVDASRLEHAYASVIAAASEEFCPVRRWVMMEPMSALIASIPTTTPRVQMMVTIVATAPRSRRELC